MIIAKQTSMSSRENVRELDKFINKDLRNLFLLAQGRIRFGTGTDGDRGENISGEWQVVSDTGVADTEFAVSHNLGAVPIGYLVMKISNGGVIYDSGTAWTSSVIYLKSSAANSAVTLFLIK